LRVQARTVVQGKLTQSLLRACFQALGESFDLAFQSIQEMFLLRKPLGQERNMFIG